MNGLGQELKLCGIYVSPTQRLVPVIDHNPISYPTERSLGEYCSMAVSAAIIGK